jgi:cytochrome c oxidase cbb3-type subunit 3
VNDGSAIATGKATYATNCASCHGPAGGGIIGPNLTDDYWIHGGSLAEIRTVVADGVLDKGMPPWNKLLKPDQVNAVVAYISTLRGTNPAGAKPPQGELVRPASE